MTLHDPYLHPEAFDEYNIELEKEIKSPWLVEDREAERADRAAMMAEGSEVPASAERASASEGLNPAP